MRSIPVLALALATLLLAPALAAAPSEAERVLVVLKTGEAFAAPASDGPRLQRDPRVASVEPDGTVRSATASWETASWDTASWDTASWDTASWDTASWDTASWDTASWDTASWDTASWDTASWDTASWDGNVEDGLTPPWGLVAIGAPRTWSADTPAHNRLVCIVDSGVDATHPALRANLWTGDRGEHGWNAIDGSDDVRDAGRHGTHLAGIVAAARASPYPGVGSPLVASVRALGADGTGRTSHVLAGIDWCAARASNVILLALTEDTPTKAFRAAIERAQRGGALVVAAAGNVGPCERCVGYPASLPRVLSTGAAGPDGEPAPWSASGPALDLVAPGVAITAPVPGGFATASGTSQAAAFAAGAAALVWSACPAWSAGEAAAALVGASAAKGGAAPLLVIDPDAQPACSGVKRP